MLQQHKHLHNNCTYHCPSPPKSKRTAFRFSSRWESPNPERRLVGQFVAFAPNCAAIRVPHQGWSKSLWLRKRMNRLVSTWAFEKSVASWPPTIGRATTTIQAASSNDETPRCVQKTFRLPDTTITRALSNQQAASGTASSSWWKSDLFCDGNESN